MKKLSDRVWETRKTRIYTEKRLRLRGIQIEIIMIWYSFLLVSVSVLSLKACSKNSLLYCTIESIFVLVASVYLSAQRFSNRAEAMRNNYVSLELLESNIRVAEKNNKNEEVLEHEKYYCELLNSIENHSDWDYLLLRFSRKSYQDTTLPPFGKYEWIQFVFGYIYRASVLITFFILPIIIAYFTMF